MTKAISLTIETQTEDFQVLSLCHISEKMLALENSIIANKMLKLNRDLFDKINQTTKLVGGTLYRQEITREKGNINRTYVQIDNRYDSNEEEIASLRFEDNTLKQQRRAISKFGKNLTLTQEMCRIKILVGTLMPTTCLQMTLPHQM